MVEPGDNVSNTLRKEFTEEALAKLNMPPEKRNFIADRINRLFQNGVEVMSYSTFIFTEISLNSYHNGAYR